MKKILIFILLASLCSFTTEDRKADAFLTVSTAPAVSVCNTTPAPPIQQTLSEQVSTFFASPFETQWWPARWQCGTWSAFHGWLYIGSDLTIALSYFLVPFILMYFLYKRKERSGFRIVLWFFILFILACGLTHLMDASMFWWPAYRLSALLRFTTAIISLGTGFMLIKVAPLFIQFRSPEALEEIVKERTEELRKSMLLISAYQRALDESAIVAITDQHGMITHVNENFCNISKYSKEELIGKDHRIINSGYHDKEFIKNLWSTITQGKIWKGEVKNKAKDGTMYWVETTIIPFLNEQNKPYQYVAILSDITIRKEAEAQPELLALIVNSSDDAIISKNTRSIISSWNKGAELIFGYSSQEAIGKHISMLIPPDRLHEESEIMNKIMRGEHVDHYETERKRKDGTAVVVSLSIAPIKDNTGMIIGASKIARDITEIKKARIQLKESEEKFRNLILQAPVLITIFQGPSFIVETINKKALELWEKSYDQVINKPLFESSPELEDGLQRIFDDVYTSGEPYTTNEIQVQLKRPGKPDTAYFNSIYQPLRDLENKIYGIILIGREVTEVVNARKLIKTSEEFNSSILESSPDCLKVIDNEGRLQFMNSNGCKLMEVDDFNTIKNTYWCDMWGEENKEIVKAAVKKSLEGGTAHFEAFSPTLKGTAKWWDVIISPVTKTAEGIEQIISVSRDISEKKKLEELLEKSNRLAKVGNWEADLIKRTVYWSAVTTQIHEAETDYVPDLSQALSFYKEGKNRDRITQCVQACIEQGTAWDEELQIVTAKGNLKWIRTIGNAEFREGKCIQFYGSFQDIHERKKAEEAIKDSEEKRRLIMSGALDAIICIDTKGSITFWNPQAEKIFGWNEAEVMGQNLSELIVPEPFRKYHIEGMKHYLETGEGRALNVLLELSAIRRSGEEFPIELTVMPVKQGEELFFCAFIRDITQRKKAEDELLHSKTLLENAEAQAGLGSWELDIKTQTGSWSKQMYHLLGFDISDQTPTVQKFLEHVHPDDRYLFQNYMMDIQQGIEPAVFEYRNNPEITPLRYLLPTWHLERDSAGNPVKLSGTNLDITERKKAEEKLRQSEAKFKRIFDSKMTGIIFWNETGEISDANERFLEIVGYTKNDLEEGKLKWNEMTPVEYADLDEQGIKQIQLTGVCQPFEKEYICKDGSRVPILIGAALLDNDSSIKGVAYITDITERKKAEEELSKKEIRFRSTLDKMMEGVAIIDFEWRYLYLNDSYSKQAKHPIEELLGFTVMEKFPGIEQTQIFKSLQRCFDERITVHLEDSYTFSDDSKHWFEMSFQPVPEGIFILSVDITERRKAEGEILKLNQALILSERRFRGLIENSDDMIALLDANFKSIYRSPSVNRILGWNFSSGSIDLQTEIKAGESTFTIPVDDQVVFGSIARESLKNPSVSFPVHFSVLHKLGHYLEVEGTLTNWLENNSIGGILLNVKDVTSRKKAEAKLRQSETLYRTIASSIPGCSICLLDKDHRYFLVDGDLFEKLGYTREKLLGNKIKDVLPPELYADLLPYFERAYGGEICNRESVNDLISTISRFVPLKDEQNKVYAVMAVVIDITELKKAERAIVELNLGLEQKVMERTNQLASVNKELESFSYSVSHDLRAPLRAINGYSKMLEEDYQNVLDDNGNRLLRIVQENAKQMGNLIDDLLMFSRLGRKEVQKSEVNMLLLTESVVAEIKTTNPKVQIKINPLHSVWGDIVLLKQVLCNYILNAVKYSSKSENPLVEIKSRLVNDDIIFCVTDNGSGFDMQYAHKLFQVFQRLHTQEEFEGTGVGLAIVHRIITKHNGKVWAEAEIEKGATFYFSLPTKQASIQAENN